ncbi:MAG: DUF1566 domain-containing protein [Proteobacteria bacterium]|nr:MAG: DUF1566 domain-containing protein [Pseudomonadota bacterium]
MNRSITAFVLLSFSLSSCFKAATQSFATTSKLMKTYKTFSVTTAPTDGGGVSAVFTANSSGNQLMQAADDSTIKDSSVSFPPGTLAISTTIRMEEGASFASAAMVSEMGLDTKVTQSGTAVAVVPNTPMDAKAPFVVKIPLPVSTGLMLDDPWSKLVVMYRVNKVGEGKIVNGILPRSDIVIENGVVSFQSLYFGSFQTAVTSVTVMDKVQAETKAEIITKQESISRPALQITARSPFVTKADGAVEINGINFRPSMIVALAGKKVSGLRVESDSKASFIAPSSASFGLSDITVEQEGVTQTVSVFYSGSKTDFPIMIKVEAEVCLGEKFYDASGSLKTGSRICDKVSVCSQEGQLNCLTSMEFPSVQKSALAAKVLNGQSVAGVAGTGALAPAACSADGQVGCVANVSYPAVLKTGLETKVVLGSSVANVSGQVLPRPADCSTDGGVACVVDGTLYKAAKLSNFVASNIQSGVQIAGLNGTLSGTPSVCSSDGQTGCVSSASYPSVDKAVLTSNQAKMRSGFTIGGVAGTLTDCSTDGGSGCVAVGPSFAAMITGTASAKIAAGQTLGGVTGSAPVRAMDCNADGATNCTAIAGFPAVNLATLNPGVIKSGVMVAGVSGNYPSPTFKLTGATATPALDSATFNAKIKSSASFEWFDASGVRHLSSGNSALTASNFLASVSLFGETGLIQTCATEGMVGCLTTSTWKPTNVTTFDAFDVRAGKTIAGVVGKMNFSSNGSTLTIFNRVTGSGANSSTSLSDAYDSIDDYNGGGGASFPSNQSVGRVALVENFVRETSSDTGIGGGGVASNGICDGSEDCIYQDKQTGLYWSKVFSNYSWESAIAYCASLSYGSMSSGWRLPMQKEFMGAYINGINFARVPLGTAGPFLWTATTDSMTPANAYAVYLHSGQVSSSIKSGLFYAVCVHGP